MLAKKTNDDGLKANDQKKNTGTKPKSIHREIRALTGSNYIDAVPKVQVATVDDGLIVNGHEQGTGNGWNCGAQPVIKAMPKKGANSERNGDYDANRTASNGDAKSFDEALKTVGEKICADMKKYLDDGFNALTAKMDSNVRAIEEKMNNSFVTVNINILELVNKIDQVNQLVRTNGAKLRAMHSDADLDSVNTAMGMNTIKLQFETVNFELTQHNMRSEQNLAKIDHGLKSIEMIKNKMGFDWIGFRTK